MFAKGEQVKVTVSISEKYKKCRASMSQIILEDGTTINSLLSIIILIKLLDTI